MIKVIGGSYHLEILQFFPHQFVNLQPDLVLDFDAFLLLDDLGVVFLAVIVGLITHRPHR